MDWKFTVLEADGIVHAVLCGEFKLALVPSLMFEALTTGRKHRINRYLADVRATTSDISTTQIYLLPRMLEALGLGHGTRVALVISENPEQEENFEFYKTVSLNQGFNINLFHDPDTARQWLVGEGASLDTARR